MLKTGKNLLLILLLALSPGGCVQEVAKAPPMEPVLKAAPRPPLCDPALFNSFKINNHIDELVLASLKGNGYPPSETCSDEVFIRRVYLDTTGLLPSAQTVMAFLGDQNPEKRKILIDKLLGQDEFADYWAMKWGDLLRIKAEFPSNLWPNAAQTYHRWVRESIRTNMPYDKFVRKLLCSSGSNFHASPVNFYRAFQDRNPKQTAENVALLFMGVRLNEQNFSEEQILGMAVFFSKVAYKNTDEWKEEIVYFNPDGRMPEPKPPTPTAETKPAEPAKPADPKAAATAKPPAPKAGETVKDSAPKAAPAASSPKGAEAPKATGSTPAAKAKPAEAPKAGEAVKSAAPKAATAKPPAPPPAPQPTPRTLDGKIFSIGSETDPRVVFADWLTDPKNPWFAKNISNRIWFWLMGRGIIHEVDDIRPSNPASSPELLAYLEEELVKSKYNTKHLFRLILNSNTYQLSSVANKFNEGDEKGFSHYRLRRIDAEPLIDIICQITSSTEKYSSNIPEPFTVLPDDMKAVAIADGSISSPFLELFGRPPRNSSFESERNSSISQLQLQHMLNSSHIQRKIQQCKFFQQLLTDKKDSPTITDELYLRILSRLPTEAEKTAAVAYLASPKRKPIESVYDLAWALLNTKEFILKH